MPSVREKCSCGAEMEITDAPLPNALASIKAWRSNHSCNPAEKEIQALHGSTGELERSIGFTVADIPAKEYDPFEDRKIR
jgi:hypothetical protein